MAYSNNIKIETDNLFMEHYNIIMQPGNIMKIEPIVSDIDIKSEIDFELENDNLMEFSNNDKYCDSNVNDTWTTYIWVCSHCHVDYNTIEELRSHAKEEHIMCNAFACFDCNKKFSLFDEFIGHAREHRRALRSHCQYCKEQFTSEELCREHVNTHKNGIQKFCELCGELLPYQSALDMHQKTYGQIVTVDGKVEEKSWKDYHWLCQVCGSEQPDAQSLRTHAQTEHDRCFVFKCADCTKRTTNYNKFVAHVTTHRPYLMNYCQYCNTFIPNVPQMNEHISQHIAGLQRPCYKCGQMFSNNKLLVTHRNTFSGPDTKKRAKPKIKIIERNCDQSQTRKKPSVSIDELSCKYCLKIFDSKQKLKKHTQIHDNTRPRDYVCQICNKAFFTKHTMEDHAQTHRDVKSEICLVCNKQFSSKRRLRDHILSHSNIRPFICDDCGASFKTKRALQYHLEKHSQNKVYRCSYCRKGFKLNKHLINHRRKHAGKTKNYTCEHCGGSFASWGSCNQHMIRKHGVTLAKHKTGEVDPLTSDSKTLEWLENMLKDERKLKNSNLYRAGYSQELLEQKTISCETKDLKTTAVMLIPVVDTAENPVEGRATNNEGKSDK